MKMNTEPGFNEQDAPGLAAEEASPVDALVRTGTTLNWDKADAWAEEANRDKQIAAIEPRWSWDCGLKLDYDGGLLTVCSRFYPVRENIFDGSVSFYIGDTEIFNREFSSKHIDVMKEEVEKYVSTVTENVQQLCSANLGVFVNVQ